MIFAYEDTEDPGHNARATGSSGWALLLGHGDGFRVVDHDPRNAALTYAIDGVGDSSEWLEIDFDAGEDLVLVWLLAHVYEDGDLEFSVSSEEVLIEGAWGTFDEEAKQDLLDGNSEVYGPDDFPEVYPVHLGLTHANCSHSITAAATRTKPGSMWETEVFGWRCVLCGLVSDRYDVIDTLAHLMYQRAGARKERA